MNHDVFAAVEEPGLVLKAFRSVDEDEPAREWNALSTLSGSGLAPEPVEFAAGGVDVIVMTRVTGRALTADELVVDHAHAIGRTHRVVHDAVPRTRRPPAHRGVLATRTALMLVEPRTIDARDGQDGEESVVARAWDAAAKWMRTTDVERLLSSDRLRFSRGDPNLANYLWTADGLVLVDWEHSGDKDPVLELADMAEHASTRQLTDEFWDEVAAATELTNAECDRVRHARRLMACFWLVLIWNRHGQGLPTTVSIDEQAHRTLATLWR